MFAGRSRPCKQPSDSTRNSTMPAQFAAIYAHSGEQEYALQSLQQAIQLNRHLASEAQRDEDFRSLRSDPDFAAITPP